MRRIWPYGGAALPPAAAQQVALGRGERVLAWEQPQDRPGWLVVTTFRLVWVEPEGRGGWDRPWHEVAAATWDRESSAMTVTWVQDEPAQRWVLEGGDRLLSSLRERVQASVVVGASLELADRRTGKVAIRRDLASGALHDQVVLGGTARPDDPQVVAEVTRVLADLHDQVGLPPL